MKVQVRLFARARDAAGTPSIALELPDQACVGDLRSALAVQCPELASLAPNLLVSIGNDYADERALLSPGCEIACFPAVSGG